jgi:phospholipase/carboxylesterase
MGSDVSRRRFGALAGSAFAALAFGGACRVDGEASGPGDGRLTARPRATVDAPRAERERREPADDAGAIVTRLGLEARRDATLRVPSSAPAPHPLLVVLHGASGSGDAMLRRLGPAPADAGVAVLAPDSRGGTWDAIRGAFGADVEYLNRALQRVFDTTPIDPARVAIGGFSDGATYALSLGLINGDLFRRVIAFSPGFVVPGESHGRPSFFISHGTADRILPIDECSRAIVPVLRRRGYEVTFREFDGPHTVPADVAAEALAWMAK